MSGSESRRLRSTRLAEGQRDTRILSAYSRQFLERMANRRRRSTRSLLRRLARELDSHPRSTVQLKQKYSIPRLYARSAALTAGLAAKFSKFLNRDTSLAPLSAGTRFPFFPAAADSPQPQENRHQRKPREQAATSQTPRITTGATDVVAHT